MKLRTLFTAVLLSVVAIAHGQLAVPPLRQGQFVYTISSNFDPPLIGQAGIDEINQTAKALHYPYYVVLVDTLPPGNGGGDQRAADAINYLAEQWAARYPSFDLAKSQIFLLAYSPRVYRFLAGSKFEADLGFRNTAHKPYTDIFDRSVQSQRKDPKNGIINMMKAVDDYLFDATDPARIKARQEAARLRAEQQRLINAQGMIDSEINRLDSLLRQKEYLPSDVTANQKTLADARRIRLANSPVDMVNTAASMKSGTDVLEQFVQSRKTEEVRRIYIVVFRVFLGFLLLLWLVVSDYLHRSKGRNLRKEFDKKLATRMGLISNATNQYFQFYNDRGDILLLAGAQGKTQELYGKVTAEVDDILIGVEALRLRAEACKAKASEATYFNQQPLKDAIEMLDSQFDFDTGVVNDNSLFEPTTRTIKVSPGQLIDSLGKRFEESVKGWQQLIAAVQARAETVEKRFPTENLDDMYELAKQNGIPLRWLATHPLAGNTEADEQLYKSLNELAWSDPLEAETQIAELRRREEELQNDLERLINATKLARSNEIKVEPTIGTTVVDASEDPRTTCAVARRNLDKLSGVLASAMAVDEVEAQARKADELFRKSAEQAATIESAVKGAQKTIKDAGSASEEILRKIKEADLLIEKARTVHKNVDGQFAAAARRLQEQGTTTLREAEDQLAQSRHLYARNKAEQAMRLFVDAGNQADRSLRHCAELDSAKKDYESRLENLNSELKKRQRKISDYGGNVKLRPFTPQHSDGLMDYVALSTLLTSHVDGWDLEVRNARRDYEAEQERIREEERRRQRQLEAEEAARRQASYNSSFGSGSSGSSWGSNSHSSSGGSWGGGSDSSSGGSW